MQSPFQMWRPPYIVQCRMQSANIKTSSKKQAKRKEKKTNQNKSAIRNSNMVVYVFRKKYDMQRKKQDILICDKKPYK